MACSLLLPSLTCRLPFFRCPQHQKPNTASPEVPEVDEPMVSTSRTGSAPANKTFLRKGTLNRRVSEKALEAHKHRCAPQLGMEQGAGTTNYIGPHKWEYGWIEPLGDVWGYGSLGVDRLYLKEGRVDVSAWLVCTAPD